MKFVICGNYGAGNRGDEMILAGMLRSLRAINPRADITVLSGDPEKTTLQHNVRSFPMLPCGIRSRLKSLFNPNGGAYKAIKECDYFILGGGGLFTNLTYRAYVIWNCQAQKALKFKKPIIMYGQSVGPVEGKYKTKVVTKLFSQAHFIAVRDKASQKQLQDLGIKDVHLMPDLALRKAIKPSSKGKNTIVAPRYLKNLPKNFDIKGFIRKHKATVINFHPKDKLLTNKGKSKPAIRTIDKEYRQSQIVVGMRLHSIVTAVKHAKPFIAFNYSPKVRNFVDELGLQDQVLEMNEFGKLEELYEKTLQNSEKITSKINKYLEKSANDFKQIEETLQTLLKH